MNRKLVTAAVAVSAMTALGACGSSSDTKPAARGDGSPSSSTTSAGYDVSAIAVAADGSVDGRSLATKMSDAMLASKSVHATSDGTAPNTGAVAGESDFEFSNPVKVAMKFSMKGMNLEAVAIGGLVYIKGIPGTTKPWLKVDPKGTDAFSVAMSSVAGLSKSADPRLLNVLIGGIKGHYLGTEQVDGVWTGRFSFQLSMSALPAGLTARPGMEGAHVAMDYWVGDDNLPRKVTTVIEVDGKKESTGSTYSGWGKPVNIVAPPAAQVGPPPTM